MKLKKLMASLMMMSGLLTISCSTNDETSDNEVNLLQIESVEDFKLIDEQRIAFSLLSNQEKATLWENKLKDILSTESLTSDQANIITDLLSMVKPEAWDRTDPYHEYFCDIYLKGFVDDASQLFDHEHMFYYFYSPSSIQLPPSLVFTPPGFAKKDCDCLVGTWLFDCSWVDTSECKTTSCVEVDGCGILNTSFCDGRCR